MEIKDQLQHLDDALLSGVEKQLSTPLSEAAKAMVNAYLVLAHAVLEEHLESIFANHYDRLVAHLSNPTVPVECVRLTFAVAELTHSAQSTSYAKLDLVQLVRHFGRKELEKKLAQNHGLKPENIMTLAKCVGLHWPDFDQALTTELADLTTLGAKRGSAGHLSPYTERVTSIEDDIQPSDVRSWVTAGYEAVQKIESYLSKLTPEA